MRFAWMLVAILATQPLYAGAFLTDINFGQIEASVNHPVLYLGVGGLRTIRVCLDPEIADVDSREPAVTRAIASWNAMAPASNNLTDDVPAGLVDFETTLIHEMGHCFFGLAHPNLGARVADPILGFATQAEPGPNGFFDVNVNNDMQPGTIDDFRADDVNRVWYFKVDNYPYLLTLPVDKTTFSRDLLDLPKTSLFAANPNRLSGLVALPPVLDTEAVMNGSVFLGEGRRTLQHDDVATFLHAASGLDELAGTADDYSVSVVYQGRTTSGCDVIVEDLQPGGPAPPNAVGFCEVDAIGIGGAAQHFRIAGVSRVQISNDQDWYYGPEVFADNFESGDASNWSGVSP